MEAKPHTFILSIFFLVLNILCIFMQKSSFTKQYWAIRIAKIFTLNPLLFFFSFRNLDLYVYFSIYPGFKHASILSFLQPFFILSKTTDFFLNSSPVSVFQTFCTLGTSLFDWQVKQTRNKFWREKNGENPMEFIFIFRNELNYVKNFTFPNYLIGFWIKFDFLKSLFWELNQS